MYLGAKLSGPCILVTPATRGLSLLLGASRRAWMPHQGGRAAALLLGKPVFAWGAGLLALFLIY